jgi:GDP-L-fucose synthase
MATACQLAKKIEVLPMTTEERIYVAGHRGMVGSAICRLLIKNGLAPNQLITRTHADLDLTKQAAVQAFFNDAKPTQIYLAAAKVGGIYANSTYPADFIYDNLMIQSNVIHAAHQHDVQKLLFLGSSCIYPRDCAQPMSEDALLTGKLEPTNEPYAIAKIAGIKLCESYARQYGRDYRSVMPTNLYGPGDNYHPENSHVIPAMIRRFHEAKINNLPEVTIWGSGTPMREFLYVDDMASACVHVMNLPQLNYALVTKVDESHINVGSSIEISIAALAEVISQTVGYEGAIRLDATKPDGSPRKLINSSRIQCLGWNAITQLRNGISITYQDFLSSTQTIQP